MHVAPHVASYQQVEQELQSWICTAKTPSNTRVLAPPLGLCKGHVKLNTGVRHIICVARLSAARFPHAVTSLQHVEPYTLCVTLQKHVSAETAHIVLPHQQFQAAAYPRIPLAA